MLMFLSFFIPLVVCASEPVNDYSIADARLIFSSGKQIKLGEFARGAPYLVIISHGCHCPTLEKSLSGINSLVQQFHEKVRFILINANPQDSLFEIHLYAEKYRLKIPVVKDPNQRLLRMLGVVSTTTAIVLDTSSWRTQYIGAISDQIGYDYTKTQASEPFLANALTNLVNGWPVKIPKTTAVGCAITYLAK
jgi:hypothetical protein